MWKGGGTSILHAFWRVTPFPNIDKHFDVFSLDITPYGPFALEIEQIRQERGPPDLFLVVRSGSKLSATFNCRLLSFLEIQ